VAIQDLIAAGQRRSFDTGDTLIRQGEPADGLLILLDGIVRAVVRECGGAFPTARFGAGDVIGEMALVAHEPRTADVVAESPVQALFVDTAAFDELATRHLELATLITDLVADRLGQAARDGFSGKRVEAFRILRCIGRGSMSVVYRAEDEATGDLAALKMMSYRLIYDSAALSRFPREADIVQRLDHPNIARLKRLFPAYRRTSS
jgi:CRP-like cAMP-binding protein